MTDLWRSGNVEVDGAQTRGWFVGHFLDPDQVGLRATDAVEIKWFNHPAGDRRAELVTGEIRTTVLLLIRGRFRLELSEGSVLLATPGDYAMWGPGVDHTWEAEEDSTLLTVRWPSAAS